MTVLVFFLLIGFVFWITSLHDRPDFEGRTAQPDHGAEATVSPGVPRRLRGRRRTS